MDIQKELVRKKVSDLIPYKKNPRTIPQEAIDDVCESYRQCGVIDPIEIDEKNVILSGHTRRLAALQLEIEEVDCLLVKGLTSAQKRKYRILANKTGERTGWDYELLAEEIEDLDFEGYDFEFDIPELDVSFSKEELEEADDYEPTIPEVPKAKRGQIYQLGDHRLMCGDSSSPEDVEKLMDGEKADMVFTDPPYGVAIGDKNAMLNTFQRSGRCTENIENDTLSEDELYEMLKAAFINVRENCNEDATYFVTSPQGGSLGLMMLQMMSDAGLPVRHVLMWKKNSPTFSLGRLDYDYQHEPIFYTWTEKHHNYRGGEFRSTVWEYDKPRKCDLHPTMKPVALVINAILDGSKAGDIVLDVFGGSGTTIIAAEKTNRCARMMELDPHYVDVIIDRWEQFTGGQAVLLNG